MAEAVPAARLRSFVERVERLNAEIRDLNNDKSEIFEEAKSQGWNVKALKEVIKRRAKDQHELQLLDTDVDLYLSALGESPVPYARTHAREDGGLRKAAKDFVDSVPEGGSVSVIVDGKETVVVDKRQPAAAE